MMINYRAAHMESVAATASHMVKQMLERQPLSPAKVTFAYRVAAGPALAKAASAVWTAQSGVLTLHARGAAWCRDNGIGYYQFLYWRDKLQRPVRQGKTGHFIPLSVAATPVRLECNGVSLLVSPGFDPLLLQDIVSALRNC